MKTALQDLIKLSYQPVKAEQVDSCESVETATLSSCEEIKTENLDNSCQVPDDLLRGIPLEELEGLEEYITKTEEDDDSCLENLTVDSDSCLISTDNRCLTLTVDPELNMTDSYLLTADAEENFTNSCQVLTDDSCQVLTAYSCQIATADSEQQNSTENCESLDSHSTSEISQYETTTSKQNENSVGSSEFSKEEDFQRTSKELKRKSESELDNAPKRSKILVPGNKNKGKVRLG